MTAAPGAGPRGAEPDRTVVVFCGPSIAASEVRARFAARAGEDLADVRLTCLPPAAQGDVILAVRTERPHTIAIIDGVFERVPAVWHKEILWAMDAGIHVFGSSSMGALRAAELHRFGMVGVGRVFEQFRDGDLDDDDEVALIHGVEEDGFRAVTTAMVDLRHLLAAATGAGVVTERDADLLEAAAKALPYQQRSLTAALRGAPDIDSATAAALRDFASAHGPGQKHLDALGLVDAVVDHLRAAPGPFLPADWFVEPTVFLDAAIHEVDHALALGDDRATDDPDYVTLAGETTPVLRKQALLRILAREVAHLRGIRTDAETTARVVANFRERYRLEDPSELARWLSDHGLTEADFLASIAEIALVDRVERSYHHDIERSLAPLARFAAARRARTPGGGTDAP